MKIKDILKKIGLIILALVILVAVNELKNRYLTPTDPIVEQTIQEDGSYNSKEDVALYLHTYSHLPNNYVTKEEAKKAGWEGGSVERYLPGCAIGGDVFTNYQKILPTAQNRKYYECDIDTIGEDSRGAKRIVFSNDGLIYYTGDHYESFEQLYGGEK